MKTSRRVTGSIVLAALLAVAAPAGADDIVDTAKEAGSFNTLLAAVEAAGLTDALRAEGLTVFAPTDEAFEKLPKGTVEELLKPENKEKLTTILTYHVVPGRVMAKQAAEAVAAETLQGTSVVFAEDDGHLRVSGARIAKADIEASNGVIHVIDEVIMPGNIVELADAAGQFGTLLAAAKAAGLAEALADPEAELTVFAPSDAAFAALPAGTVEDLLRPANKDRLAAILKYHVLPRRITVSSYETPTLQGDPVELRPTGTIRVNEAEVVVADIKATNGVIHVIDSVLLPEMPEPTPERKAMALIELAIQRGVPMFNHGRPAACAAIYEVAARSLLDGYEDELDDSSRKRLTAALKAARRHHDPVDQAWALRRALDHTYARLRK